MKHSLQEKKKYQIQINSEHFATREGALQGAPTASAGVGVPHWLLVSFSLPTNIFFWNTY